MNNEKKYYVYLHKRKDNGLVFYIGKGTSHRITDKSNRNIEWNRVVKEAGGFISEIIHNGLTSEDAEDKESFYLNNQKDDWLLVNKKLTSKVIHLDRSLLSEAFEYSENSPSGLIWKKDIFCGEFHNVITAKKNTQAGNRMNNKKTGKPVAWQVCLSYKTYLVHRIIYTLMVGEIKQGFVINHIDNNPHNNELSNLEMCSIADNNRRTFQQVQGKVRSDNKTGVVGIVKTSNRGENKELYITGWRDLNGKLCRKSFNIATHGEKEAFRLACEWRTTQLQLLNQQGAGYTDRHGT